MIKRLSRTAALLAAIVGMTIGFSVTPASASTSLPANNAPGQGVHSLGYVQAGYVPQSHPAYRIYVVKSGNTLSGIAHKFDLNWKKLYCANMSVIGKEPSLIQPKMRLKIRESRHVWCHIPLGNSSSPASNTTVAAVILPASPGYVNYSSFGSFQQCVIQRESGGNPRAVNPYSGAGGLYQFLPSTWAALGFPGLPQYAPVWMQNEAFAKAYAQSGTADWAPYDGC